jgi:hypothetical protein
MAWHVESRTKSQKGSADRRESEMYVTESGQKVFVVDGHIHLWDARPENRRNRYGLTFIESFWGSHVGMTPDEQRWNFDRFCYYGIEGAAKDLFVDGYVDAAIMLPTNLRDFYVEGFNTIEQCSAFKNAYPEKVVLNGRFDPRDGQKGLDAWSWSSTMSSTISLTAIWAPTRPSGSGMTTRPLSPAPVPHPVGAPYSSPCSSLTASGTLSATSIVAALASQCASPAGIFL